MRVNKTFAGLEPTWANACVGENGNPQIFEYASGYASGANLLLDKVIENEGMSLYVDVFIYPICFNIRHSIELFLKSAAMTLGRLSEITARNIPVFDLKGSHDIGNIWGYVKSNTEKLDERYSEVVNKMDEYIIDFAEIDATGQVFRYPFDLENTKHLQHQSIINIVNLQFRWKELHKLLIALNSLSEDLLREYGWKTFTKKLSRFQIAQVASLLPSRDKWASPEFSAAKDLIRNKFKIGSREFSDALNIIQERKEFSALICQTSPIKGIDAEVLKKFFDIWIEKHELHLVGRDPSGSIGLMASNENDFREMVENHKLSENLKARIVQVIKPEEFVALKSLYYFDREDSLSEVFERILEIERLSVSRYYDYPREYLSAAKDLLEKPGALKSILNSLNFLGQKELVNFLLEKYDLQDRAHRLLESSDKAKEKILQLKSYI